MKTVYRIEAWCICKDQAAADTIANSLITSFQQQKTNGNVASGHLSKQTIDQPETVLVDTTV